MNRTIFVGVATAALLLSGAYAHAEKFSAAFSGFNEVGPLNNETGAILSEGTATLDLDLNRSAQTLTYTLSFSGLSSNVTQAHIHFGKIHTPGGIVVFLCSNLGNGPAGTPACPATGGTVTGTLSPASVVAVPGQNIAAGDFDAISDAISSNTAYGNIHTTKFPGGEIRGQVHRADRDDDDR